MMRKSLKRISITIAILLVVSAGALFLNLHQHKNKTAFVKRGSIVEGVYGIGTVKANKSYQLRSGILTTITRVYIREGDSIKAKDPIIDLDEKTYHAPFDGTITNFPFKTGENVAPQVTILSLIDFSDRYLVVDLEQEAALRVKTGQTAILSFDSLRSQSFEGRVESVYSQDQSFLARINIGHLPRAILPGMTADVAITIKTHKNAILIPIVALDGDEVHVTGKSIRGSRPQKVKIGVSDGQFAQVLESDLGPGDELEVITKPKE